MDMTKPTRSLAELNNLVSTVANGREFPRQLFEDWLRSNIAAQEAALLVTAKSTLGNDSAKVISSQAASCGALFALQSLLQVLVNRPGDVPVSSPQKSLP